MSGTYKAVGINLKSTPLGETDRLLTILTDEQGLIRVVAPGARKHKSSLGGRSSLFVVNQLLLAKGKNLDKITQAESIESFPGLSQDLRKLTAAQYLAELTLCQALSDQPQSELLCLLREHLSRIEKFSAAVTLPSLVHATFHLLALAGLAPQLYTCCISQQPIQPEWHNPDWQIGFSVTAGGTIRLDQLERLGTSPQPVPFRAASSSGSYQLDARNARDTRDTREAQRPSLPPPALYMPLDSTALNLLQQLTRPNLIQNCLDLDLPEPALSNFLHPQYDQNWLAIERVLRHYAQYHFDRPIRSATLIDACFSPVAVPSPLVSHDAIV